MTKEQLIEELEKLRQRFSELESHDIKQKDSDEMRRKYEFIVNTSRHFMTLVSRDFVFEAANTAYCKAIGKSRNQVVGHTVADVWGTKLFRKSIKPIFEKCFEGNTVEKYHDIVHFPELGSRPFEVSYYPYHDKKGNITHAVVVSRDISERRMIEEELIRLEKLESLGVLAGGIAHDFNNLLTSILGNVGLAKRSIDSQGKTMTQLNKAENSCKRAKNLTHKLLTFATGGEPVKKLVTFYDLLADALHSALKGAEIKYELSIAEDSYMVEVDVAQISQAVCNIILNADQAMPQGGKITVTVENVTVQNEGDIQSIKDGDYVQIVVQDEGLGIPEKHLKSIFDPYFTTKQKGRGLGLATAYSIIRNHEGYLTVGSILDTGTSVYIHLPASKKEFSKSMESAERDSTTHGRILVMDDEAPIRDLISEVLEDIGCSVDLVDNGEAAIELYKKARKENHPFDAVVLDLTIPCGMGGRETIERLKAIDPNVKAIVSSGYSHDPVMASFSKYGFCAVIPKPYEIDELCDTIRRVIKQ